MLGPAHNPLRHLGTLGFLALWLLAATGIVLYALFDTSVAGAWHSVERLAHLPLGSGRLLRGLHRYAADLLMVVVALHIVREWLHGHARGARRFHWLTGVPAVVLCFITAIGGFWLNWDHLAQYSAISTFEWLDTLPLFASPLARNFLAPAAFSDRMFSLFVFVHVGLPLLLLFALWFHIQRLSHVAMLPPRRLTLGVVLTLAGLALVSPVLSHPPAALGQTPVSLRIDWLLLWLHPVTDATSPHVTLALLGGALAVLLALPFVGRASRPAAAVVHPQECSGCGWCFDDCPYAAISMVPRPGQPAGRLLAHVDTDLCTACGICAGACPSSTPLRTAEPLVTGIDLPRLPVTMLRNQLRAQLQHHLRHGAEAPVVAFTCRHGATLPHSTAHVVHSELVCTGQLPPSFIEYALRSGAAGVLVAACPEGGCEFRLGERWIAQRLTQRRPPQLRPLAEPGRLQLAFAAAGASRVLEQALQALRARTHLREHPLRKHPLRKHPLHEHPSHEHPSHEHPSHEHRSHERP